MQKYIPLFILSFVYNNATHAQNKQNKLPMQFTYQYVNKNDSDKVKLIAKNVSPNKTFYYSIAVQGLADTGWVGLLSDINSLGQNDFWALKPIKPHTCITKYVSKKKVLFVYAYYKIRKIRFNLVYYEKKDFESKSKNIYLPPM